VSRESAWLLQRVRRAVFESDAGTAADHNDSLSEKSRFGMDGRCASCDVMIPPFNSLELRLP
jgi:hypothetical protein